MLPAFNNPILAQMHDGAAVMVSGTRLAFTTDSYVVKPLFFPGGDIGKLAVCGTVNDLAMTGAVPQYLSAGFIIEEGFAVDDLQRIVQSMSKAAQAAGVAIVTGDTKVVEKGGLAGVVINTAGIGAIMGDSHITASNAMPGQDVIVSGYLGDHSIAVMAQRYGLKLPQTIASDCAPLNAVVKDLLTAVPQVAVLRDPTRGGVATTLNEIAEQSGVGIIIEERAIPVRPEVQAACEILGFDPLYLANEGKMLVFVEKKYTKQVLEVLQRHEVSQSAQVIGEVTTQLSGQVALRTTIGGLRLVDMLTGDQLPRIC
jgi:hydrogenase expression/formation protein HypE